MQRIGLDEKSARRIAEGTLRDHSNQYYERCASCAPPLDRKGGKAAIRRAEKEARVLFGRGLIDVGADGRKFAASGITWVDDTYTNSPRFALAVVVLNTRSGFQRFETLLVFSQHAVDRAMQRTGHGDPVLALRVVSFGCLHGIVNGLLDAESQDGVQFDVPCAVGTLHCVTEDGLMVCKTFIDFPSQGAGPLAAGAIKLDENHAAFSHPILWRVEH